MSGRVVESGLSDVGLGWVGLESCRVGVMSGEVGSGWFEAAKKNRRWGAVAKAHTAHHCPT